MPKPGTYQNLAVLVFSLFVLLSTNAKAQIARSVPAAHKTGGGQTSAGQYVLLQEMKHPKINSVATTGSLRC